MEAAARLLSRQDLAGRRVLVTAGPTHEDFDPVRFSDQPLQRQDGLCPGPGGLAPGRGGHPGERPQRLPAPYGVERVWVRSAREMQAAVLERLSRGRRPAHGRGGERLPAPQAVKSGRSSGAMGRGPVSSHPKPRHLEQEASQKAADRGGVRRRDPRSGGRGPAQDAGKEPGPHRGQRRQPAGFRVPGGHQRSHHPESAGPAPVRLPLFSKEEVAEKILDRVVELLDGPGPGGRDA